MSSTPSASAIVPADDRRRTTVTIELRDDPWAAIDAWAIRRGFGRRPAAGSSRLYQKGIGLLVAPMMVAAEVDDRVLTLQAWVRGTLVARLFSLFLLPAEMHVRSGGFKATVPRNIARKAVNELIGELGGQPIP